MRRIFISLIAFYAVADSVTCSDLGKDGFNIYKDYLRGRNDDLMMDGIDSGDRLIYFYRTPLRLYPGLLPAFEQEYKKRNENVFKKSDVTLRNTSEQATTMYDDHMMTKEAIYGLIPTKRTSKTALSYMMQNKLDPFYSDVEHYCLYGK